MTTVLSEDFRKKLITSILVILLYFMWPSIVNLPLQLCNIDFEKIATTNTPIFQLVYNMAFNILLMIILLIIYRKSFGEFIKDFKINYKKHLLTILKYLGFTIVAVFASYAIKTLVFGIEEVAENDMILYNYFKQIPPLMIFMTVIYYPIVEELVFNHTIKVLIKNKWLYIIISSLFFWYFNIAFIGINYVSIVSSFYYFAIALLRAYAYHKTNNLLVPIGIKMLYNAFVSLISF